MLLQAPPRLTKHAHWRMAQLFIMTDVYCRTLRCKSAEQKNSISSTGKLSFLSCLVQTQTEPKLHTGNYMVFKGNDMVYIFLGEQLLPVFMLI